MVRERNPSLDECSPNGIDDEGARGDVVVMVRGRRSGCGCNFRSSAGVGSANISMTKRGYGYTLFF